MSRGRHHRRDDRATGSSTCSDEKERFNIEERTASTIEFTYVSDGFPRHGFLAWLDLRGTGVAEVEVAVTGREMDARGAAQLISRVTAGMRLAAGPA